MNDQRAMRQYLESLQRAGVSWLPRASAGARDAHDAAQSAVEPDASSNATPSGGSSDTESVGTRQTSGTHGEMSEVTNTDSNRSETREPASAQSEPTGTTTDERRDALTVLAERVAACTRCQELAETRTQTVFGVGDPNARLMFIGEAPGADEDRQGEPFVGRAGQLLDKIIEACQLKREDVYICNILRCRPPGNRNPSPVEAGNCREYLDGQISIVRPEYIVCWGSVAAQNLLDCTTAIGKMRGRFFEHGAAKVLCTYHPSYLLRNPSAKKQVWADMKFLMQDMGVELS